jgi:L-threonylcarbamoyladenylate synthase
MISSSKILKLDPKHWTPEQLQPALKVLEQGGIVALPTDTVYGIVILESTPDAQAKLNTFKGRSPEQALIRFLPERTQLFSSIPHPPLLARRLTKKYWPGPLTVILEESPSKKQSFRVPGFPLVRDLLSRLSGPVLSTRQKNPKPSLLKKFLAISPIPSISSSTQDLAL